VEDNPEPTQQNESESNLYSVSFDIAEDLDEVRDFYTEK
jgi:hypothetical protein